MATEQLFRRFEITCGEEQKETLLALINKKGLSRQELMLILKSMRVRSDGEGSLSSELTALETRVQSLENNATAVSFSHGSVDFPKFVRAVENDMWRLKL